MSLPHKTYYSLLDVLRFFAAFWVMNFHYLSGTGFVGELKWYRYGNLGVQLFFIISGFVIVQSLEGKTLKEFAKSRFVRLFPLFWVLCTITYILTLTFPHASHVSLMGYLVNMTMLPDVIIGFFHKGSLVDAAYWTLTVELLFYIGIGLFCALFSFKKIRCFLLGWFCLSIIAFAFQIDHNFYVKLLLVRHASYFIFGSALALIAIKQARNTFEKYFDRILLLLAAGYSLFINARAIPPYTDAQPADAGMVTWLLAVFFVGVPLLVYLSTLIKNPRVIRILAVVGGLTYPLYLLHQRIGNVIMSYGVDRFGIPWNTLVVCFEVMIIAVAYVVSLQDKKIRTWLQKKLVL